MAKKKARSVKTPRKPPSGKGKTKRKTRSVKARKPGPLLLGVDLGGTKILAVVADRTGRILGEAKHPTLGKQGPDAVINRIAEAARQAMQRASADWTDLQAMGVGAPGPVDPVSGTVYHAPNLPGWDEVALGPRLGEMLGVPVFVENDVNAGTYGEFSLGAGRGVQNMVGIFVGTGVGGGLILDGALRQGFRGAAGEIGHMVLLADGPVCGCGRRGCLEALASRVAISRDIWAGIRAGRESLIPNLIQGTRRRVPSGALKKALAAGDELVAEVMGRAQWYLGLHAASLINVLDPEMLVYGGGVVEALGDAFLAPIRTVARQYFIQQREADRVQIVPAQLGDYAGVLGVALLARRRRQQDSPAA
jgi:glucokinase